MKMVTHESVSEDLWRGHQFVSISFGLAVVIQHWAGALTLTRAPRAAWCCHSCTQSLCVLRPGTGRASQCCPQRSRRWCRREWQPGSGSSFSSQQEMWPESRQRGDGGQGREKDSNTVREWGEILISLLVESVYTSHQSEKGAEECDCAKVSNVGMHVIVLLFGEQGVVALDTTTFYILVPTRLYVCLHQRGFALAWRVELQLLHFILDRKFI